MKFCLPVQRLVLVVFIVSKVADSLSLFRTYTNVQSVNRPLCLACRPACCSITNCKKSECPACHLKVPLCDPSCSCNILQTDTRSVQEPWKKYANLTASNSTAVTNKSDLVADSPLDLDLDLENIVVLDNDVVLNREADAGQTTTETSLGSAVDQVSTNLEIGETRTTMSTKGRPAIGADLDEGSTVGEIVLDGGTETTVFESLGGQTSERSVSYESKVTGRSTLRPFEDETTQVLLTEKSKVNTEEVNEVEKAKESIRQYCGPEQCGLICASGQFCANTGRMCDEYPCCNTITCINFNF